MDTLTTAHGIGALHYAARGWRVFPLQPNSKVPLPGSRGCKDASKDADTIRAMFATGRYNTGIATGGGLLVVDVDCKAGADGAESLTRLEMAHGELPVTPEVETPSGGLHIYLRVEGSTRNTAGRLGVGLDTRGDGGYVVAPPSTVDGRAYRWRTGLSPADVPLAPAPAWLLGLLDPPRPEILPPAATFAAPRKQQLSDASRYVAKAIYDECMTLANTPEHHRNDQLNRSAFALARFVVSGEAQAGPVRDALFMAARHAGLHDIEIQRTIRSAFRARRAA